MASFRLDAHELQVEHQRLVHEIRFGRQHEIESALSGKRGRLRPDSFEPIRRVANLLGHNDAPHAARPHAADRLVDRRDHRARSHRERQDVFEAVALERAALGLVPCLEVASLVADRHARPVDEDLVALSWKRTAARLVLLELQPAARLVKVGEFGPLLAFAAQPVHLDGGGLGGRRREQGGGGARADPSTSEQQRWRCLWRDSWRASGWRMPADRERGDREDDGHLFR
mmetsp:Transcript_38537/g.112790  ORF Transcript_38537/g.112790 Transcript_38537/m.112790 type:complete len:229 (-) Transcript_38537:2-688(-)